MAAADKIRRLIAALGNWSGSSGANARLSNEFQPDAVELEQRPPPRIAHATLYALLAFIATGLVWASFSKVDMIVVAQGRLVSTAQTFVIQSLETAVVRSIDVRVGQTVKKGETVATLDPTFAVADAAQTKQRIASLDAEIRRLVAEMNE
jgi:hemolysin D